VSGPLILHDGKEDLRGQDTWCRAEGQGWTRSVTVVPIPLLVQSQISDSASEVENKPPPSAPARETEDAAPTRPQEESEETWEEKEDKLAPEKGKAGDQKYRYKEGEPCLGL